jgi:hypothetical protein
MSEWISVTDKLPEPWKLVLCWVEPKKSPLLKINWQNVAVGYYVVGSDGYRSQWTVGHLWTDNAGVVTHWSNLPKGPNDE